MISTLQNYVTSSCSLPKNNIVRETALVSVGYMNKYVTNNPLLRPKNSTPLAHVGACYNTFVMESFVTQKEFFTTTSSLEHKVDFWGEKTDHLEQKVNLLGDRVGNLEIKFDLLSDKVDVLGEKIDQLGNKVDRVAQTLDDFIIITQQQFERVDKRFECVEDHIIFLKHETAANGDAIARLSLKLDSETAAMRLQMARTDECLEDIDKHLEGIDYQLDGMDKRFDSVDERFGTMDKRFDSMDRRFDSVDERFGTMDKRFGTIDAFLGIPA